MEAHALTQYLLYQLYHARVSIHSLKYEGKEEQLHEFRVALRRIRSLVKLFLDDSLPFPKTLKTMMKITNPLREFDVLLDSLTPTQYPKLFKQLSKLRKESFITLFTPEFIDRTLFLMDEYSDLLSQANPNFISEILIQKVLTHYQQCLETYTALEHDAKPKQLHQLRIKFKDARYGFEFLEVSEIHKCRAIILRCKKMQNTLGAVQDAVNQVKWLKNFYQEYPSSEAKDLLRKRKKVLKELKNTTLTGDKTNR